MPNQSEPTVDEHGEFCLVSSFVALQSLLLDRPNLDGFLGDVARLAAGVVPLASCGITVRRDGQPLTVASSDERAERVDEVQYGAGEGPCLETLYTGAVIDVPDLAADSRWPAYQPHALGHGVRSSVSFPLTVEGTPVGALNLYGYVPNAFDAAAHGHAQTFAAQAAAALTVVLRTIGLTEDSAHLERALISRTVIDQAVGILMAQQRCNADQAFALLRAHSQNNNRKLREVAADLITRTTGEPPLPSHGFDRRRRVG